MKEARKCLLLEPLEGAQPCWHLDLGLLASRAMRINSSCFKLPDLWLFIATSVGNSSTREWIEPVDARGWTFVSHISN